MFDLTGKTALLVGAGSGIGEAGAYGLAAFGATVCCADVDAETAERTAEEARSQGWQAESVELDMTGSERVDYLASDVSSYVLGAFMLVGGGWTAVDGRFTPPF